MKKKYLIAVPFALALAVTGCSSSGGSSSSSASSSSASGASSSAATSAASTSASSSAAASSSETSAASSSAVAGGAVGGFTAEELEAIVTKLSKGETGAVVMSEAKLLASADQSEELVKSMKITPATCADLQAISDISSKLDSVNVAAYTAADAAAGTSSGITLMSYEDSSQLSSDMSKFGDMDAQCKTYSLEMQGLEVKAAVTSLDISTDADSATALQQDIAIMDQKVSTYIAQAVKGNVAISATTTGDTAAEGVAKLEKLVNAAVAELK
ncbi:hypothetical protein [Neomicrococcus aestuarii]|uniref:PknH-like extracellular domain-containing protein n=1 Tax=Neomicrococcus aestuarii TaxID=556325 RepID=A0A1L2ZLS1_9MICC|nr:hypothetical protein [Neomicrococcus aestuarii]APF40343.1 hypothetical protein BHE16_04165 [Neomicrococcus aestuarii]